MYKQILCVCLLLALCSAQLTVKLNRAEVRDTTDSKKIKDYLYNYQTDDQQLLVFDTRANKNYEVQTPSGAVTGTASEFTLGKTQQTLQTNQTSAQLKINGKRTSPLKFTVVSVQDEVRSLVNRVVGLQIPAGEQDQYFPNRLGTTLRTKSQSFSFFFSADNKVNKVFFGEIQNYLVENLITFPVSYVAEDNRWQLKVTQFNKVQENTNYFASSTTVQPRKAVFDSTTSKILVDSATLQSVINGITNLAAVVDSSKCQLIRKEKYVLNFQFELSQQDKADQSKINSNQFRVNLNDLLLEQSDKSCILLLQSTAAATDPWVLGTTFLQNVYAYFDFDSHSIQLSNIRAIPIDSPTTDHTWGTVFIVVGILLALLSLAILLTLIKPITYVPQPVTKAQPQPQQQTFPQSSQFITQPQRVIVYQQPITYSVNQSSIGQSPTRFVQQGFPTVIRQ